MRELIKDWWKVVGFWLVIFASTFYLASLQSDTQSELEQVAVETHSALCALRAGHEQRLEQTLRFLDRHEGREPIPGITREEFRQSLDLERSIIADLSALDCTI